MALIVGDEQASSGMSKAIYDQLNTTLSPSIPTTPADLLPKSQASWKQLAFCIATGVVAHLKSNLEIAGLQVTGHINVPITGTAGPNPVTGTAQGSLASTQTDPTTGLVR
jgi:hypothetical protein